MLVDPVQVFGTGTLLVPTSTKAMVTPMPTIVPVHPVYQKAGASGERVLWIVFSLMLISSGAFALLSLKVPMSRRLYHFLTTLVLIIATLSYFGMAIGQGKSYHHIVERESHKHVPDTTRDVYREVYWARYVDWALTTPLLLLDLCLLAGLNGGNILMAMIADVIMILTGMFAAFGQEGTPQKWGWYTISLIAYLVVIWHLILNGLPSARARSGRVGGFYYAIGGFTLVIWTLYPIVWAVADGSRRVNVNTEIVLYAILDFLAKPVFGAWLLWTHRNMPDCHVDIGGFWSNGLSPEGQIRVGDDDDGA